MSVLPILPQGFVVGRILTSRGDSADADKLADTAVVVGMVDFTPATAYRKLDAATVVTHSKITAKLDSHGDLHPQRESSDNTGSDTEDGIWLPVGTWKVTYRLNVGFGSLPEHNIEVTTAHTEAAPLPLFANMGDAPVPGATYVQLTVPLGGQQGQVLVMNDGSLAWGDVEGGVGGGLNTEGVQDVVGAMIVGAGGTYDDGASTITLPGEVERVTLTSNLTYTLPASVAPNRVHSVVFTQDGVGGHTVTYGAGIDGTQAPIRTAAGAVTVVELYPIGVGQWRAFSDMIDGAPISTEVTPLEPTFTDPSGSADDRYVIPSQAGVVYRVGGTIAAAGTYTPAAGASVTITAEADTGWTIAAGATASWTYTFSTTVANTAPSLTLEQSTITGLQVSQPFTTHDADGDTVTVTVDWGDGTAPGVVTSPAVHTYATAGTYDATFTPNDGTTDGAVRTASYTVAADSIPPVGNPATLAQAMIDYGAEGYWKLDETTGTTAADSSGNNRHGTIVGAVGTDLVLAGEDGYLKWVSPGAGAAPAAYVDVPSSATFSIPSPSGAITVFLCQKIVTPNAGRVMVRKGVDVGSREWQFDAVLANLRVNVTNTSGTHVAQASSGDNVNINGTWWAHAAILPRPGGADTPKIYFDGAEATVTTAVQAGSNVPGSGLLRIGSNWVGGLGHVAIFPYELTGAHIAKLVDLARAEGVIP